MANSKQRLFEVMEKTDKTFKPKNVISEGISDDMNALNKYQNQKNNIVKYYYRVIDVTYAVHGGSGEFSDIKKALDFAISFSLERHASIEVQLWGVNDENDPVERKTIATINYKLIEYYDDEVKATATYKTKWDRMYDTDVTKKPISKSTGDVTEPIDEKIIGKKPTGKRDDVAYYKGSGAFPGYTHFAVLKQNNKIINGWDYRGYDSEDLNADKRAYFFDDIRDMQFDPRIVKVVTTKHLQKQGIDPFNFANWLPNEEYKNFATL